MPSMREPRAGGPERKYKVWFEECTLDEDDLEHPHEVVAATDVESAARLAAIMYVAEQSYEPRTIALVVQDENGQFFWGDVFVTAEPGLSKATKEEVCGG